MMSQVRIAVAGAGPSGARHTEEVDASESAVLAAIVDPSPSGTELAAKYGVPQYPSLTELIATDKPDGIILATPSRMHVDGGLQCVAAGVPVLVDKPIGHNVIAATRLVKAGERARVPVLTGHHRNYAPIMTEAREIIRSGVLGTVIGVSGTAMFYKPDEYFDVGGRWRREPGSGPILLDFTHEINNVLSLIGDIATVMAATSNPTRGFPAEDTSAMIFYFANGALGTFLLLDAAASAHSWEHQPARQDAGPSIGSDEDAYHIVGTQASLSMPTMRVSTYEGSPSSSQPLTTSRHGMELSHPLTIQMTHFADVIRGDAHPLCSGRDGLKTLQVVEAIVESARIGRPVDIAN